MQFYRKQCYLLKKKLNEALRRRNLPLLALTLFIGCLTVLRLKVMQQEVTFIPGLYRCRNNRSNQNTDKFCSSVNEIFFLKTHKCASSTVQNILMRYGDTRNLSFLLPQSNNYIGHPQPFSLSMLSADLTPPYGFDIFCHHTRFQEDTVHSVMSSDSVFITILRNPVDLFESLYGYYLLEKHTGFPLEEFADSNEAMAWLNRNRYVDKIGSNQMLFDLGYDENDWSNYERLEEIIDAVDKTFDFVMIAEKFEESLLLLKERLCWDNLDVIYFNHNRRSQSSKRWLDYNKRNRLVWYNAGDKVLYDYFYQKLQKQIDSFGRGRMAREVKKLQRRNDFWYRRCVDPEAIDAGVIRDTASTPQGQDLYSFQLKRGNIKRSSLCHKLTMGEISYTEVLRKKQRILASVSPTDSTSCYGEKFTKKNTSIS